MPLPYHLYHSMGVENRNILFDGLTYATLEVDETFVARLAELKSHESCVFGEHVVDKEISILADQNVLSREDILTLTKPTLKKLILLVTDACNLRCKYCFENNVDKKQLSMPVHIADASIKYLMKHSVHKSVEIRFFGGEPLLNIELMKHVVENAKKLASERNKEVVFSIVTNGTRFTNDVLDFFSANSMEVQVSIDGCKEGHNANRVFANGDGSYDLVCKNLKQLQDRNIKYYVFTVASKQLLRTGSAWISEMDSLSKGKFDFLFVADKRESIKPNKEEINAVLDHYREHILLKTDHVSAISAVQNIIKNNQRCFYGCNAGLEDLTVMPNGDINLCQRLTSQTGYNVLDDMPPDKLWRTYSKSVEDDVCNKCWAKYLCGGGCAHASLLFEDGKKPVWWDCEKKKLEIEAAIKTLYNRKEEYAKQ